MRLAPVAIYFAHDPFAAETAARAQCETTHRAAATLDACAYLATLLLEAMAGADKEQVLRTRETNACSEIAAIAAGSWIGKRRHHIESSGYVVHTLEAALWAVAQAEDFKTAILLAANLGDDADTVAAVTGHLAGALWGVTGIPVRWRQRLAWYDHIEALAGSLFNNTAN